MKGLPPEKLKEAPAQAGAFCSFAETQNDTIAAIATAPGVSGIGIVRISGPDARQVADSFVSLRSGKKVSELRGWQMALGDAATPGALEKVDEVIAAVMRRPRSYTGEDVVEVHCHGGRLACETILSLALQCGARQALPGEFTKRAYISGRISLEEAEAVLDIINAPSEPSLRAAARRLSGELGERVRTLNARVVAALAELLAGADFPEDVGDLSSRTFLDLRAVLDDMRDLLASAPLGLALADGLEVCLVGKPNAGKSSLFNALLGRDRAIVTGTPGTTRDVLRERTEWGGLPVILEDTAGLRETSEVVEAIGVERARGAAENSEVVLYVLDDTAAPDAEDFSYLKRWAQRRLLAVVTKTDLGAGKVAEGVLEAIGVRHVKVSSVTKEGLKQVKDTVIGWFSAYGQDGVYPGSARQVDCLQRAHDALGQALSRESDGWTLDVVVKSLEDCAAAFAELTGEKVSDEVLEQVFSRFCVGK